MPVFRMKDVKIKRQFYPSGLTSKAQIYHRLCACAPFCLCAFLSSLCQKLTYILCAFVPVCFCAYSINKPN